MMKLILFVHKDFYLLSKTMLSPIVHDNNSKGSYNDENETYSYFERCDWGFVHLAIEAGIEVSFRKPTTDEINKYEKRLENIRNELFEDSSIDAKNLFPVFSVKIDESGLTIKEGLGAVFNTIKRISE